MLLGTYRLGEARLVIDRWMRDAPADARPYLWLTQFDRRIEVDNPGSWEHHYREALQRDPGLDTARLGLAETLDISTATPRRTRNTAATSSTIPTTRTP